jgi:phage baseplate assembly protein W
MADVPHFSLPFRFAGSSSQAAVSEQDSLDEIADCVYAILVCPVGFRVESPLFGLPDPTFSMPGPDLDEIRAAVETWEPRAAAVLDGRPDAVDELLAHVETYVQIRSEA